MPDEMLVPELTREREINLNRAIGFVKKGRCDKEPELLSENGLNAGTEFALSHTNEISSRRRGLF
jgi:hypothetical protein